MEAIRTGHLQVADDLTLREQFKLVEIAGTTTTDTEVKRAALAVLGAYLNRTMFSIKP